MKQMRTARVLFCSLVFVISGSAGSQAQTNPDQGFSLSSTAVVVDQAEHWVRWTRPKHATSIDLENHTIGPRLIRRQTNAIEDIDQFQVLIGDEGAYSKLLKDLDREGRSIPLNIRTGPATVAGVPIVYLKANEKKGIKVGDPILWYFFHGGIRYAPTNPELAPNILDGDLGTYWEPSSVVTREEYDQLSQADQGPIYYFVKDRNGRERRTGRAEYEAARSSDRRIEYHSRSLANWYIDLDLGRLVPVNRIVLHYVAPELGEPFRQLRILGTPSDFRDAPLSLVARTITPNEDQTTIEFDLDQNEEGLFTQLQILRLAITDSRFDKFREISEAEFLALPLEDQGGIDYYILNAAGSETRVEKEIYDQVGPGRQGRLVYYQRERPRLAAIEVWTQGDNIALGVIDGGGSVNLTGNFAGTPGFDGRYESNYLQLVWSPDPRYANRGILNVDLGALFWLSDFRMVGAISGIDEMVVHTSDGGRDANGNLRWTEIHRQQGGEVGQSYEKLFPVRYLATQLFSNYPGRAGGYNTGDWIREFQLFGEGYPSEITLTSPIIELPGSVILGPIEWDAEIPDSERVDVQLRTRTGDRLVEMTEYYGSGGEPKTQTEYSKLPTSFQGPVVTRLKPGGGWSSWSQRYLAPGDPVTSPSPRRYLQLQVQMFSQSLDIAGKLRSVRVHFLPPVARRATAEIWPEKVPLGTPQDFEFYLNPIFVERQPGGQPSQRFDEIMLNPDPIEQLDILAVSLGGEEDLRSDAARTFDVPGGRLDPATGDRTSWFEDASGTPFQALVDAASGDTLKIFGDTGSRILRLPARIALQPRSTGSRLYHRTILQDGEEVPVDDDGRPLNQLTYLALPPDQQGRILYFAITGRTPDGAPIQTPVDDPGYRALPDSLKGEIRYFRKLVGKGGEFPFDQDGNTLDETAYNALPAAEKGAVLATGQLVRVRFRAEVLLNGTTLEASIRDSGIPDSWQQVDPGDATTLTPGAALSISVPFSSRIVRDIAIEPNPFTPNGDGVNDQVRIHFSLGNLNIGRQIEVQILDLSGRRVWTRTEQSFGNQQFLWDGRDASGQRVPPGIYLCRIDADIDADKAGHQTEVQPIAVAY